MKEMRNGVCEPFISAYVSAGLCAGQKFRSIDTEGL